MAEVQIIKPSIDAKHIENITKRTKKKKVCAYCRVSTDMEDQRTSYLSQINHYTDYIKKNKDWEFAVFFIVLFVQYAIFSYLLAFSVAFSTFRIYTLS